MYNFYANMCMDEDDIKEAMYRVRGAPDAYYNALDQAEMELNEWQYKNFMKEKK